VFQDVKALLLYKKPADYVKLINIYCTTKQLNLVKFDVSSK